MCSDDRGNPRNVSILRSSTVTYPPPHVWWVTRGPVHATRSTAIQTHHHTLQDATGSKLQLRLHTTHPASAAIGTYVRLFVNTDSGSAARLPPSTGYRNVLVEISVHFVHDAESRDEQVPTFRNNVLPSPSWFNDPVTLRFATTDLTENTSIGIVTNTNGSHSCYGDVQVSRCSLAHCHCYSECTWDFLLCQPPAASGFRLPQSVVLPRNEITTRKKGGQCLRIINNVDGSGRGIF